MNLCYLLDTNICIYIAKKRPLGVLEKFAKLSVGEVGMSAITYGELYFGACQSQHPKKTLNTLKELTHFIPTVGLDEKTSQYYGEIRAHLKKSGKPIGNNDLWIAAHAKALNVTLVTNNEKEFKRVPKLRIENWV